MDWLKKAPTAVVIAVTVVCGVGLLGIIGGYVATVATGGDVADYRTFVNTMMNGAGLLIGGVAAVGATSAAKSASKAEENTNGVLSAKADEIARAAVETYIREQHRGPSDGH
jgi:hypothetical protein